MILEELKNNSEITRRELEIKLGATEGQEKYHIEALTKAGIIKHEEPTKGGKWIVRHGLSFYSTEI
jgi:ATP-dependent DNA helicase RecG